MFKDNLGSSDIEEFDRGTITTLERVKPSFLAIRDAIGVGVQVGFGSLPQCHTTEFSLATLSRFRSSVNGVLIYQKPTFIITTDEFLTPEEEASLVVKPDLSQPNPHVLSLYDGLIASGKTTSPLTQSQIEGLTAHEMVHWRIIYGSSLPESMLGVLKRRRLENGNAANPLTPHNITTDEVEVDILTSLFGFKRETLDVAEMLLARLQEMKPEFHLDSSLLESWQKTTKYRKSQVIKYT